jgi:translation initiation factor 3 subunit F
VDLEEMLGLVLDYVDDVIGDRVSPDNSIGRSLLKLIQAVPKMPGDDQEKMLNSNIKVSWNPVSPVKDANFWNYRSKM